MEDCPFCLPAIEPQIILSDAHCYAIWTQETPEGSAMVLPCAHRPTVFDLTDAEWVSTKRLLEELRSLITTRHDPDGWNVGWNVDPVGGQSIPHAHCHLLPRYGDEPHAGRGIRLAQGPGQPAAEAWTGSATIMAIHSVNPGCSGSRTPSPAS